MACREAPVAQRLYHDSRTRYGTRVGFLGIIGDQAHQRRTSGHNCAPRQESAVNGAGYEPGYAHAIDIKVFGDRALGLAIVQALCRDPRTRYCIFQGVLYYGVHYRPGPNGTILTAPSSGHPDHVHWSGLPGTTFQTQPFYAGTPPAEEDLSIVDAATEQYLDRHFLATLIEIRRESLKGLRAIWKTRRALIDADVIADPAVPGDETIEDQIGDLEVDIERLEDQLDAIPI